MTVAELTETGLFGVLNKGYEQGNIEEIYTCELVSLAMTKNLSGCAWFPVIGNVNTVAVAVHTGASCIILCEGVQPDDDALRKAGEYNVSVFATDMPVFDAALELNALTGV